MRIFKSGNISRWQPVRENPDNKRRVELLLALKMEEENHEQRRVGNLQKLEKQATGASLVPLGRNLDVISP